MDLSDDELPLATVAKKLKEEDVLEESRRSFQRVLKVERKHLKKIDSILHANGFRRHEVPKDGNCFFSAAILNLDTTINIFELRTIICDHIHENEKDYKSFLSGPKPSCKKGLKKLRKPGSWSTALADCLPLALANLLQKNVLMFTSVGTILEFHPNIKIVEILRIKKAAHCDKLCLAHIRVPDKEHYDAVLSDELGG